MNKKKQLAKNTIIIFFGKVCTQLISFFLLPLYTAYSDLCNITGTNNYFRIRNEYI